MAKARTSFCLIAENEESIYHKAQEFFSARDVRSAIHYLKRASKLITPDSKYASNVFSHLADCLCDLGKPIMALKVLEYARKQGIRHPQLPFARGKALLCLDRAKEAVFEFESAIEMGREQVWQGDVDTWGYKAHFAAALASYKIRDTERSIEHCAKALAIKPGHEETLALLARAELRLGTECAASGRHSDAVQCFARVVEIDPTCAKAYFSAGDSLYAMERFSEAADVYSNGLLHTPDHAPGYFTLGNCYYRIGAFEAAAMAYKQAITLKPGYFEAINNLLIIGEAA